VSLLNTVLAGVGTAAASASVMGAAQPCTSTVEQPQQPQQPQQQQQVEMQMQGDIEAWAARTAPRPQVQIGLAPSASRAIVVSTVDRFQGKDCDVVILSTVRQGRAQGLGTGDVEHLASMAGAGAGDLLRDWRRINVAITRAKVKLIVIGSFSLMQTVPVLAHLSSFCSDQGWAVEVPSDAVKGLWG